MALQMLEVSLRNRIDTVMSENHGQNWLLDGSCLLIDRQRDQQQEAIRKLKNDRKPVTRDSVVAATSFSFWTSMFNSEYETAWQQGLHKIGKEKMEKGLYEKTYPRN